MIIILIGANEYPDFVARLIELKWISPVVVRPYPDENISIRADTESFIADMKRACESLDQVKSNSNVFAEEIKRFGEEIERTNEKLALVPKPYQQRKFQIVPGSRQDKYSRSKKQS